MTAPIPVLVRRHKCPHCPRTASRPVRVREHMERCWFNPATRGCKTCKHHDFEYGEPDVGLHGDGDVCDQGVNLDGRPACTPCGGSGWKDTSAGAQVPCNAEVTVGHVGDGAEVKPGPIVHCDLWEAAE